MQLSMMRGYGRIDGYSRNSGCAGVCGRATLRWDNGPQGFGDGTRPGSTTQFPSSLAMAASWDPDLAEAFGTAMGEEWWGKGTNIFEGPGVNVVRAVRGSPWLQMPRSNPALLLNARPPMCLAQTRAAPHAHALAGPHSKEWAQL